MMRLTSQNLLAHTRLNPPCAMHTVESFLKSQRQVKRNQAEENEATSGETSLELNRQRNQENGEGEIRRNSRDNRLASVLPPDVMENEPGMGSDFGSGSIPLQARAPLEIKAIEKQAAPKNVPGPKKTRVGIELAKEKKKKGKEKEVVRRETDDEVVDREKILEERKEKRRNKAGIIKDQSLPIHERLKREAQLQMDSQQKEQKANTRRETTIKRALDGLQSAPKSKAVKDHGRITIGRATTSGIFNHTISSSKVRPTPRKGSGDLVFNELNFLDKKKRKRTSHTSYSSVSQPKSPRRKKTRSTIDNERERDTIRASTQEADSCSRGAVPKNAPARTLTDGPSTRPAGTSGSSASGTDHLHSANSLRLRSDKRSTKRIPLFATGQSPQHVQKLNEQPAPVSCHDSGRRALKPDDIRNRKLSGIDPEDRVVRPNRLVESRINLVSEAENPLRETGKNKRNPRTARSTTLDRLIMDCQTETPVAYSHTPQPFGMSETMALQNSHSISEISSKTNQALISYTECSPSFFSSKNVIMNERYDEDAHGFDTDSLWPGEAVLNHQLAEYINNQTSSPRRLPNERVSYCESSNGSNENYFIRSCSHDEFEFEFEDLDAYDSTKTRPVFTQQDLHHYDLGPFSEDDYEEYEESPWVTELEPEFSVGQYTLKDNATPYDEPKLQRRIDVQMGELGDESAEVDLLGTERHVELDAQRELWTFAGVYGRSGGRQVPKVHRALSSVPRFDGAPPGFEWTPSRA
ncbi:hypothetical protein CROQUDRAFT_676414 [Cronartium quercuum f. sp. fusiforme G11]|uniref:Uncharacterized protein n=1 Tax=Cronartium quercuum f. sp. fusiforme G11 TaxID=708437 RepID=A0A9P6NSA2_9BASI|nr:hypothetical protein CROQUDRAFT_676414 [Cronartium quercuum f. sp. fusiforme G11]